MLGGAGSAADRYGALLAHMEGARALLAGDYPAAIERLEASGRRLAGLAARQVL